MGLTATSRYIFSLSVTLTGSALKLSSDNIVWEVRKSIEKIKKSHAKPKTYPSFAGGEIGVYWTRGLTPSTFVILTRFRQVSVIHLCAVQDGISSCEEEMERWRRSRAKMNGITRLHRQQAL